MALRLSRSGMSGIDFPLWDSLGSYGGPGCTLVAATTIATSSGRMTVIAPPKVRDQSPLSAAINDPERQIEPLSDGAAWGRLIPLNGPFVEQPIALTRQLTLLGRELDNDIVVDDERTSRHH